MAEKEDKNRKDRSRKEDKVNLGEGPTLYPVDIELDGRLITSVDPAKAGGTNFQTLKNLRYTSKGIKGVLGMSKINTTPPTTYISPRSGIHFRKDTPSESHVLIQAYNAGLTASAILDNTTAIPAQGNFGSALHTDSSGAGSGRWSKAPDGCIAYCNGVDTLVWGGNESRCASFVNFDPDGGFEYDYTDAINNTLTDSANIAYLKRQGSAGGNDANSMLMLHMNGADGSTTFTDDSPTTPHTVTANGNAHIETDQLKFGTASGYFDGSGDYLSIPDNADFDFSGGTWTIDFWIRNVSDTGGDVFYQQTDGSNYIRLLNTNDTLYFSIVSAGSTVVSFNCPVSSLSNNIWHHVALVENGDNYYIFIDGVLKGSATDTDRPANYTGTVYIGSENGSVNWLNAYLDEFRVSNSARWTADFTPPTAEYSTTSTIAVHVGSVRPIRGAKFYVGTANTTAGTIRAFYWNGSVWTAVTGIADGTAVASKPLAQTGSVTFDDTKSVAKTSIINANQMYFYLFNFDGVDENTTLTYVTLDSSFQAIKDIWDGIPRNILSMKIQKTTTEDYTLQVISDNYDSSADHTYVNIGGLTSTQYLYAGFDKPVTALHYYIAGGKENTTITTVLIDYWNGTDWVAVGTITDSTINAGISMGKTGIMSWNAIAAGTELPTEIADEMNFYYYRIHFSATLSATVYLYYLTAIPTQELISQYKFPIQWQQRLWLCSDMGGKKNWIRGGSSGTVCVFNGDDSVELFFGGDEEIMAAIPLFVRFAGSVYDVLVVAKRNETYLVDGTSPSEYRVYLVAPNYGCPAPETMRTCDISVETSLGSNKSVLIWQTSDSVIIFDGNTIIPISNDISNFFDPTDSRCINVDMLHRSVGFYDKNKMEYHWLFASGSSTTLNEEWVYNILEKKWFEIDRDAKELQYGINVTNTNGQNYIYGCITDYLERLENGQTWDAANITYQFRTADIAFNGLMYESEIRYLKLIGKAKNVTANDISVTHYLNGSSTGTVPAIVAISPDSTKRIFQVVRSIDTGAGTYHSLDFQIVTSNETIGFEPIGLGLLVKILRLSLK